MNEQIFLNGAPVIGFGESEDDEKKFYGTQVGVPLVGLLTGSVAGYLIGKTVTGAVVGGLAGTTIGVVSAALLLRNTKSSVAETPTPVPAPSSPPTQPSPQRQTFVASEDMLPGQVWSMVFLVHPTKPWTDYRTMQNAADDISAELARAGIKMIQSGTWANSQEGTGHQFTAVVSATKPIYLSRERQRTIPISSEWVDRIEILRAARAPASLPIV